MPRQAYPWVVIFFLVGLTGPALAQPPRFRNAPTTDLRGDPLEDARELAKAKARRSQATSQQLARALLETAEAICRLEFERVGEQITAAEFVAPSPVLSRWREAEQRVASNRAARLASLWRDWEYARQVNAALEAMYLAGQTKLFNRLRGRLHFLDAQIRLAEARSEKGAPEAKDVGFPPLFEHFWGHSFDVWREQAKTKYETLQATTHQLRQAAFDAARAAFREEWEGEPGHRGAADDTVVVELELRMLAAEQALNPAAEDALLEKGWEVDRLRETVARAKYLATQTSAAYYAEARYARFRHEAALARIKGGKQPGDREPPPELLPRDTESEVPEYTGSILARGLARDKRAADRADPKALDRMLYELARFGFEQEGARIGEQLPADASVIAEWSDRLLEAELAVASSERERRAALERSWQWALRAERMTESKYRAGQTKLSSYLGTVYRRLEAELRLAQMQEKQKGN